MLDSTFHLVVKTIAAEWRHVDVDIRCSKHQVEGRIPRFLFLGLAQNERINHSTLSSWRISDGLTRESVHILVLEFSRRPLVAEVLLHRNKIYHHAHAPIGLRFNTSHTPVLATSENLIQLPQNKSGLAAWHSD